MAAKITPISSKISKIGPTIIIPQVSQKNDHSKVDGIGSKRATMPKDVYFRLASIPEFDWIWETNETLEKFLNMNPQFESYSYDPVEYRTNPIKFVINKDGGIFDLIKLEFVGHSKTKMTEGVSTGKVLF